VFVLFCFVLFCFFSPSKFSIALRIILRWPHESSETPPHAQTLSAFLDDDNAALIPRLVDLKPSQGFLSPKFSSQLTHFSLELPPDAQSVSVAFFFFFFFFFFLTSIYSRFDQKFTPIASDPPPSSPSPPSPPSQGRPRRPPTIHIGQATCPSNTPSAPILLPSDGSTVQINIEIQSPDGQHRRQYSIFTSRGAIISTSKSTKWRVGIESALRMPHNLKQVALSSIQKHRKNMPEPAPQSSSSSVAFEDSHPHGLTVVHCPECDEWSIFHFSFFIFIFIFHFSFFIFHFSFFIFHFSFFIFHFSFFIFHFSFFIFHFSFFIFHFSFFIFHFSFSFSFFIFHFSFSFSFSFLLNREEKCQILSHQTENLCIRLTHQEEENVRLQDERTQLSVAIFVVVVVVVFKYIQRIIYQTSAKLMMCWRNKIEKQLRKTLASRRKSTSVIKNSLKLVFNFFNPMKNTRMNSNSK
jgi:hypothetical protein